MEVARTATAGTDRQFAREVGFGAGREGGALFMADVDPLNRFETPQGVGEAIQRVPDYAKDALHAGLGEGFSHVVRCGPGHPQTPANATLLEGTGNDAGADSSPPRRGS